MKLTKNYLRQLIKEAVEQNNNSKKIVVDAINNTDKAYLETSLKQRNPSDSAAGSTFLQPQTVDSLKNAEWKPLAHSPEAIKSPAVAFEAAIPGKLGAAPIGGIQDNLKAVIQPAHGGKGIHRATGKLMAELAAVLPKAPETDFTTIILGPGKENPSLTVWTFHPGAPIASGDPIFMEDVKKKFNTEEDRIETTVGEAKKLGFEFVKHVPSLPAKQPATVSENFKNKLRNRLKEKLFNR